MGISLCLAQARKAGVVMPPAIGKHNAAWIVHDCTYVVSNSEIRCGSGDRKSVV